MSAWRRLAGALVCGVVCAAGCSSGTTHKTGDVGAAKLPKASAAPVASSTLGVDTTTEQRCDPIGAPCMLPLPERPLHRRRRVDTDEAPAGARLGIAAREHARRAHRRHRSGPGRRLEPGLGDDGRDPEARCRDVEAARAAEPKPSLAADLADRAASTRPPASAIRSGRSSTPTPIRASTPLLMIHPAEQLRRRAPHRRRRCAGWSTRRARRSRPTPAFAAYRDGQRTTDATFEARRPSMERIFTDLARRGRAPQRPAARVGLHRREHAEPHRPHDRDPRRRLRGARRRGAEVHGRQGHREPEPVRPAPDRGHVPDAALPDRRRASPAAGSCSTRTACPIANPARSRHRSSATSPRRRRTTPGAHGDLRPRPARRPHRGQRRPDAEDVGRLQHRVLRHQLVGHGGRGRPERGRGARRPVQVPVDPGPASSRASSRTCSSGG